MDAALLRHNRVSRLREYLGGRVALQPEGARVTFRMQRNLWFWLTIVLAAAALVASALLFVDYVRPAPVFCEAGGGCAKIKETTLARPFGVPLPAIGIAGMLGIALLTLVPGRRARVLQAVVASVAGVFAVALFAVQAMMGVICPFCAVVDAAAILIAGACVLRWWKGWDPPEGRVVPVLSSIALLAAIAIPLAVGFQSRARALPEDLPAPIAAEIERTPSGKVTIVDFIDFECPFCRMTHEELVPVLERYGDRIHLVRKHVPLRMHPHAMDAAKASCCADDLGRGDEMADALFRASPGELTAEGCEQIAKRLGLDVERFRACVNDPSTLARIEKDRADFRASGGQGLPTIWVDGTKLEGAQDRASLEEAVGAAIRAL